MQNCKNTCIIEIDEKCTLPTGKKYNRPQVPRDIENLWKWDIRFSYLLRPLRSLPELGHRKVTPGQTPFLFSFIFFNAIDRDVDKKLKNFQQSIMG